MPAITIRDLPEEVHRSLKIRAAEQGKSAEAFVRDLLSDAVKPKTKLGTALAEIARKNGAVALDIERDKMPARTAAFK